MARPLSHKIVASKMDILMEQRNHLQTFVHETDKVLQMATSWLENEDSAKSLTSSDMNKMIDDKLAFLVSTDFSVGCEEAATKKEPGTAMSSPSEPKSTDQPLPAGHVHVSGVTVAPDDLKTILSQVNEMQDAMSSLSTSSKMLSEKQLAMEKLVETLSDKYSKVEQEKLREIERELADIKEKHKKAAIQQDKRMTSFEKKIQVVTDSQSDIIENCHQQQLKIKDQKKETEKLKTQSQQFTKDLRDVLENVQELNAEICVLEKRTATNTQMGALEGEIESLKENLEELSTRFEECGSSLEELSTRFEEHGSSLEELTKRNDETLNVLSSVQESESEKLQKLEEKLSALENSWSETTVENGKLCQDVETKLDNVCDQMADILPKFLQVEQQTPRLAIGFSATVHSELKLINRETLILSKVKFNIGDHYDSETGEFTAPLDGLYAVYFKVTSAVDGAYIRTADRICCSNFVILKIDTCNETSNEFSLAAPLYDLTQTSTFGIVEMKAREKLFVQCLTSRRINVVGCKFIGFKIF